MCMLSLMAPGHTDPSAVRTVLGAYNYKYFFVPARFCTQICWDVTTAAYAFAPLLPITLLENCELESKRALVGVNQRTVPQKGWSQLIFLNTVYRGSKTPGEYFVLTRIENGTCTAPVGPGFWVNASVAPSNFHFAWFQDLLHFDDNFCMGPFVMSR